MRVWRLSSLLFVIALVSGCFSVELDGLRCDDGHPCLDGYACVEGACRSEADLVACTTDGACPAGERCASGYCLPGARVDAGPDDDAGPLIDGGPDDDAGAPVDAIPREPFDGGHGPAEDDPLQASEQRPLVDRGESGDGRIDECHLREERHEAAQGRTVAAELAIDLREHDASLA